MNNNLGNLKEDGSSPTIPILSNGLWGKSIFKPHQILIALSPLYPFSSSMSQYLRSLGNSEDPEVNYIQSRTLSVYITTIHCMWFCPIIGEEKPCHSLSKRGYHKRNKVLWKSAHTHTIFASFWELSLHELRDNGRTHFFSQLGSLSKHGKRCSLLLVILCTHNIGNSILVLQVKFLDIRKK